MIPSAVVSFTSACVIILGVAIFIWELSRRAGVRHKAITMDLDNFRERAYSHAAKLTDLDDLRIEVIDYAVLHHYRLNDSQRTRCGMLVNFINGRMHEEHRRKNSEPIRR